MILAIVLMENSFSIAFVVQNIPKIDVFNFAQSEWSALQIYFESLKAKSTFKGFLSYFVESSVELCYFLALPLIWYLKHVSFYLQASLLNSKSIKS